VAEKKYVGKNLLNAEKFKYVRISVRSYLLNHAEAGSVSNPSPVQTLNAAKCILSNE
jgi:hypothetical protein